MVELLQTNSYLLLILTTLLGICIGSFLNVVIYRLPKMLARQWENQADDAPAFNLSTPGSHCPYCHHKIKLIHNIPLLSYLALRGKCAYCRHKISPRYFAVEFVTGLVSFIVAFHFGFTWMCLGALIFSWALIALFMIDLKTQLLPDDITLPLLWCGLIFNLFNIYTYLPDAVIGAIAGYLSLWLFTYAYKLCTKKMGMGHGDFKLFAAFGAWMGWQILPFIIVTAALIGAVFGFAYLLLSRQKTSTPIAFGPYLAIMGFIALMYHDTIITGLNSLLG